MSNTMTFNQAKDRYLKTLEQYVPIVARVHGGNHPEFHKVRSVFDTIVEKVKVNTDKPELSNEFSNLREITNNYTVPGDVCESYEAVYKMLEVIDNSYSK